MFQSALASEEASRLHHFAVTPWGLFPGPQIHPFHSDGGVELFARKTEFTPCYERCQYLSIGKCQPLLNVPFFPR